LYLVSKGCNLYLHIYQFCTIIVDEPDIYLPSNFIKLEHSSFNLTCTFIVGPNTTDSFPILEWYDSEGNILASSNGSQTRSVVLQFINAQRNISGVYKCYAYDNAFNYSDATNLYIQCEY